MVKHNQSGLSALTLTSHAERRMQQRAVPPMLLDLAIEYGGVIYSHGDRIYHFHSDRAWNDALCAMKSEGLPLKKDNWRNICVVVANDGKVVTVFWRFKRIKHNNKARRR